ncbi:MAG: ankyrin repeat domain-containing protein, partial [Proteobacteria bacterium]
LLAAADLDHGYQHDESHSILSLLIGAGANPNSTNLKGQTMIHLLLSTDFYVWRRGQTIRDLIAAGADLEARDSLGNTALLTAALNADIYCGSTDPLEVTHDCGAIYLTEYPVNLEAINRMNRSALMIASENNSLSIVKNLLQKNVRLNQQDQDGSTALILAVKSGNIEILEALLIARADVHLRDLNHQSALDWAKNTNSELAIKYLKFAGAM